MMIMTMTDGYYNDGRAGNRLCVCVAFEFVSSVTVPYLPLCLVASAGSVFDEKDNAHQGNFDDAAGGSCCHQSVWSVIFSPNYIHTSDNPPPYSRRRR